MVKSATITVKETGGAPAADTAPAVVKAKAEAIKTLAVDTKTLRKEAYSKDNWTRRRFRLDVSLIFLGACIAYLVFLAPDDELRRSLPLPVLGTFGTLLVGYFGFANDDDKNKRLTLAASEVALASEEE